MPQATSSLNNREMSWSKRMIKLWEVNICTLSSIEILQKNGIPNNVKITASIGESPVVIGSDKNIYFYNELSGWYPVPLIGGN